MKVRDILRTKGSQVYDVNADATVQAAVAILMQHRVGALLVRNAENRVCGIITERDVLRECLHRSAELDRVPVREAMTKQLIIGLPDDDIGYAMGVMTQNRIRHLPVMEGDRLVGLISIGDVVKACLEETEYENRYLKEYIEAR
jgi:CBS domain-containing protein